jgi:hypothetical protein
VGQITKFDVGGIVCCVRENLDGRQSFNISSAQRWAEKGGNHADRGPKQERPCSLAALVRDADTHNRGVRRHRCFTASWAEYHIKHPPFGSQTGQ